MVDRVGRNISYLRMAVTGRCNYRCLYCQPQGVVAECQGRGSDFLPDELLLVVRAAAELGISRIRLTGGEPLLRSDIVQLVSMIKSVDGIESINLTTNGSRLQLLADDLKSAGLDSVNVSIDSLDPENYSRITGGGGLAPVLDGLKRAAEAGFRSLKVNVVVMDGINSGELCEFTELTRNYSIDVRFIELMSLGVASHLAQHYISCEDIKKRMPDLVFESNGSKSSGPAAYYRITGAKGRIGFIDPVSRGFCSSCNRIRFTANGSVVPCLFGETEFDIRDALRSKNIVMVRQALVDAVESKPTQGACSLGASRQMAVTGG